MLCPRDESRAPHFVLLLVPSDPHEVDELAHKASMCQVGLAIVATSILMRFPTWHLFSLGRFIEEGEVDIYGINFFNGPETCNHLFVHSPYGVVHDGEDDKAVVSLVKERFCEGRYGCCFVFGGYTTVGAVFRNGSCFRVCFGGGCWFAGCRCNGWGSSEECCL
jgi:hypothetical protein